MYFVKTKKKKKVWPIFLSRRKGGGGGGGKRGREGERERERGRGSAAGGLGVGRRGGRGSSAWCLDTHTQCR